MHWYVCIVVKFILLIFIVPPVPTASPQNVQATPISSTAFSLTWQPPPVDRQNGIILGYFINVTELDTERHTQLIANTTSLSVNTGLHPFYRSHFVIAAETVVGRGPPSREHLARTLEDGIYVTSWYMCREDNLGVLMCYILLCKPLTNQHRFVEK